MKAAIIKSCYTCPFSEMQRRDPDAWVFKGEKDMYCCIGTTPFCVDFLPDDLRIHPECPLPDVEVETAEVISLRYKQ